MQEMSFDLDKTEEPSLLDEPAIVRAGNGATWLAQAWRLLM